MSTHTPITGRPVRVALVGAGNRGLTYAEWIKQHPERAELVAVADPRPAARAASGAPVQYEDWRPLAEERIADAVIVATQDRDHVEPVLALARAGYAILAEKPLAPTEEETRTLVEGVREAGVLFAVCHVMRYMPYTDLVKEVVDSGVLGQLVSVDHLEPVGWWHYAHSYVRGPWSSERDSSPMLLAKSCHDLDWLSYVLGDARIEQVASFGGLRHFTPGNAPEGSGERCLDCAVEAQCPYSALKLYVPTLRERGPVWPVTHVTEATDEAGLLTALREGPYGMCVYRSDNDVVDHQVLAMQLSDGVTATFQMVAFTEQTHRQTRIFGSHGWLRGDGERVTVQDFRTGETVVHELGASGSNAADGHGGGDTALVEAFVRAVATGDPAAVRSGTTASLGSHLAAFAAERARHTGTVQTVPAH
ncbi:MULTISPECIES: Gfo/Idh/MocA family oxidoreductase [unclassified Streptomyces]|uniref:Gfo/Idh/MocA family protein n=1 Tax=unclassified Streptomyces TaxID=2593676 RepID=UPI000DBA3A11|nr:Gfo/Idh/MocA family oxidoreductase [Streptomyces sp. PsTaAH-137]MYT75432.1 Gfo/Idh/MocA family oxidoreductase [Streptomyces sp. SID8367]RAJ86835.1 oxidoreductase family protein [Streptomyces sp. PsTaAH-137]